MDDSQNYLGRFDALIIRTFKWPIYLNLSTYVQMYADEFVLLNFVRGGTNICGFPYFVFPKISLFVCLFVWV